jgi:hypothetical protein
MIVPHCDSQVCNVVSDALPVTSPRACAGNHMMQVITTYPSRDLFFPLFISYGCDPGSAGTTTPFSSSIFASEPSWCIVMRMSQPPMNSLSTYSCGMVGHSEYSLIPAIHTSACNGLVPHRLQPPAAHLVSHIPALRSWSSSTLNAVNFSGSTPCMPRICMLARENPHCGVSGVPFMNKTTGADATALSIAPRTSSESSRAWNGVMNRVGAKGRDAGVLARVAARKAYHSISILRAI